MTRRELLALLPTSPLALLAPSSAFAQEKALTLQEALSAAALPPVVTISIGPQWEKLPAGKTAPRPGSSVRAVAQAFDKMYRRLGTVAAVTFPTMTVLNTAPDEPNPYLGIPFHDLLPLFAASLSPGQYQALTGEQGLAISELSGDSQAMALQLFDGGKFMVEKWQPWHFGPKQKATDLTAQINQTHLRFKQVMDVMLPGQNGVYYGTPNTPPPSEKALRLVPRQDYGGSQDTLYGQPVRATVPNTPKRSQMNVRQERLLKPIPVSNLTTVQQVIDRIRQKSGIELYADGRWIHKTVQVLAPAGATVIAADLLQAVALCLSAPFRQVGPAFVMTDDIVGYGTRRLLWHEFEKYADALRHKPVEAARAKVFERSRDRKLSGHGDPTTLTAEQQKEEWQRRGGGPGRPLSDFTPSQQAVIRRMVEEHDKSYSHQPVNQNGSYLVEPAVTIQLLVPGMAEPVETSIEYQTPFLMEESDASRKARQKVEQEASLVKGLAENPDQLAATMQKFPSLWADVQRDSPEQAKILAAKYPVLNEMMNAGAKPITCAQIVETWKAVPRRCVFIHPKALEDVAKEVAAAKRIGASEVWLRVFTEGELHEEVLQAACEQAKEAGLGVTALVSVLGAGKDAPKEMYDLTLLGETSRKARERVLKRQVLLGDRVYMDERADDLPTENALCPRKPTVRESLQKALQTIGAKEGVKQVVLCDAQLPGYEGKPEKYLNESSLELGYEAEMRLAFLRLHSVDPIDLDSGGYSGKANTAIVNYEYDTSITRDLFGKWQAFRHKNVLELLTALHKDAAPVPVWMEMTGGKFRYREPGASTREYLPWPDPQKPLPTIEPMHMTVKLPFFLEALQRGHKLRTKDARFLLLDTGGEPLRSQIPAQ